MTLNAKQQRFVDEYLVDLNATEAAKRAGYSQKTAYAQGQRLLKHAEVQRQLAEGQQDRAERTEITQDRVLYELASLGFYDVAEIARANVQKPEDIAELPEEVRRAVIGWSWDKWGNLIPKLSDKKAALDVLAKHTGVSVEHHKHDAEGALAAFVDRISNAPLGSPMGRLSKQESGGGED